MVRRRFAGWVVLAALVAGCATTDASQPSVDRTDVWFMQHMIPHLLQDTSIVYLTRDRLADPELARLADRSYRRDQAHLAELQGWLAERGLAPHGHSHQPGDSLRRSDLERLSRLDGAALDLAFVEVMTARHRAGGKLATDATPGTAASRRSAGWPSNCWPSSRPRSASCRPGGVLRPGRPAATVPAMTPALSERPTGGRSSPLRLAGTVCEEGDEQSAYLSTTHAASQSWFIPSRASALVAHRPPHWDRGSILSTAPRVQSVLVRMPSHPSNTNPLDKAVTVTGRRRRWTAWPWSLAPGMAK
jgi:hypothetical protein